MKRLEAGLYLAILAALCVMLFAEGRRNTALQANAALTPAQVWNKLARSQVKLQVVDVRADLEEYEDTHLPGALPFPGCDLGKTPAEAQDRIYPYVPTLVVTADGDEAAYRACARHFGTAWNLKGGIAAWTDAALPEDSGEYEAPRSSAGGGCL